MLLVVFTAVVVEMRLLFGAVGDSGEGCCRESEVTARKVVGRIGQPDQLEK